MTSTQDAEQALQLHRQAFSSSGLDAAWDRVIALVVQPGVEFGHESVEDYEPDRAERLSKMLADHRGLVFEAHSTDYQRRKSLAELVRDGFAILKVGPGLTYAMRQALFALARIEEECLPAARQSLVRERVEEIMLKHPEQWKKHYPGTAEEQHRFRVHSYSDRIRYYWNYPEVKQAVEKLVVNLQTNDIPETLLSDYLPLQYEKFRAGCLRKEPVALILDAIGVALDPYIEACRQ